MNMALLGNAVVSLAKVRAIEAMIADIDGLHGCGIPAASRNNGGHSDPTFRAVMELERLREKLLVEEVLALQDYRAAVVELETVPDDEMRIILYCATCKNCPGMKSRKSLAPEAAATWPSSGIAVMSAA